MVNTKADTARTEVPLSQVTAVTLPSLLVVLAVSGLSSLRSRAGSVSPPEVQLMLAAALICIGCAVSSIGRLERLPSLLSLVAQFGLACCAAGVYRHAQSYARMDWLWLMSVVAAAFSEELVFRVLLPLATARVLRERTETPYPLLVAVILVQLAFALAHVSHGRTISDMQTLFQLVVAGLVLAMITDGFGVGVATGFHSVWNIGVITGAGSDQKTLLSLALLMAVLAAVRRLRMVVATPNALSRALSVIAGHRTGRNR